MKKSLWFSNVTQPSTILFVWSHFLFGFVNGLEIWSEIKFVTSVPTSWKFQEKKTRNSSQRHLCAHRRNEDICKELETRLVWFLHTNKKRKLDYFGRFSWKACFIIHDRGTRKADGWHITLILRGEITAVETIEQKEPTTMSFWVALGGRGRTVGKIWCCFWWSSCKNSSHLATYAWVRCTVSSGRTEFQTSESWAC